MRFQSELLRFPKKRWSISEPNLDVVSDMDLKRKTVRASSMRHNTTKLRFSKWMTLLKFVSWFTRFKYSLLCCIGRDVRINVAKRTRRFTGAERDCREQELAYSSH